MLRWIQEYAAEVAPASSVNRPAGRQPGGNVFRSKVSVILRKSILDPQGKAVELGIHSLGHKAVENVRIGKLIELDVDVPTQAEAEKITEEVCRKLLANTVMEDYSFVVEKVG